MPNTTYSYSATVNLKQLDREIRESAIVTELAYINSGIDPEDSANDAVDVVMADALSAGDETLLDNLITAHTPPAPLSALDEAKAAAKKAIDDTAGMARSRYITIAPGQGAVYVEKGKDAQAYKDAGYPADEAGFEFITAEKNAKGTSATAAADSILAVGNGWKVIAANIEEIRIGKKDEIDAAVDINEVNTLKYNGKVLLDNV